MILDQKYYWMRSLREYKNIFWKRSIKKKNNAVPVQDCSS